MREDEGELTFLVDGPRGMVPLLVAASCDGRLRLQLRETEQYRRMADDRNAVRLYARSTLALHLAARGRPLVRGEEERARAHQWCDIGEPEGLAYKIGVFEQVARKDGWRVESPYADVSPSHQPQQPEQLLTRACNAQEKPTSYGQRTDGGGPDA
ncbi:hypothetical protein FPZ41_19890 [Streptomyces sp. K1PN6]|uniref:Uncharacterized protein n=2 Tax=Streptomyces acidicola TaxID=2596892 RepID=A0A5N8WV83_9ACTN|nr:hypothetical protein [Streptomyces acidicola]